MPRSILLRPDWFIPSWRASIVWEMPRCSLAALTNRPICRAFVVALILGFGRVCVTIQLLS